MAGFLQGLDLIAKRYQLEAESGFHACLWVVSRALAAPREAFVMKVLAQEAHPTPEAVTSPGAIVRAICTCIQVISPYSSRFGLLPTGATIGRRRGPPPMHMVKTMPEGLTPEALWCSIPTVSSRDEVLLSTLACGDYTWFNRCIRCLVSKGPRRLKSHPRCS